MVIKIRCCDNCLHGQGIKATKNCDKCKINKITNNPTKWRITKT